MALLLQERRFLALKRGLSGILDFFEKGGFFPCIFLSVLV